ncbi:MAG: NADPH-dependent oxidoreductase [Anaerolineae bacterium]|jgi:nitroreductase
MTTISPTVELMANHRSVRDYEPRKVSRERVEIAVSAAQMASTSSHGQAYSVIRVTDPDVQARIAEISGGQRQVAEAGVLLIVCADVRRHILLCEHEGIGPCHSLETFLVAVVDAALFAQNMALAFEADGLGICYIGAIRNDLDEIDRLLELPEGVLPLFGMTVGVPRAVPKLKPRLPLDAVLFDDKYPSDDEMLAHVAGYDDEMAAYYEQRGAAGRNWSLGVVRRYRGGVRDDVGTYYERKGARYA